MSVKEMIHQLKNVGSGKFRTVPESSAAVWPLMVLFAAAPFLSGVFYEWTSCLVSLCLLIYLFYCFCKNGRLLMPGLWNFLAVLVLVAAFAASAVWGVDHGMALLGFVKFLPLLLFIFAAVQSGVNLTRMLLDTLPLTGALMAVISFLLSFIPALRSFFLVNHRLAGFFQYPNTFGLYLLLGIIVLTAQKKWRRRDLLCVFILLAGVFMTGSRTTFVCLLVVVAAGIFFSGNRRIFLGTAGLLLILMAGIGIYVVITGDVSMIGRYLTTSLSSSTFLGRLLYFKDALPVILRHPLGLGYMGYFFTQGSFQTGVYSVMNVHNELLQCLLDVGWIPTLLIVFCVVRGFIGAGKCGRMIVFIIVLHSMFDFDLQFLAIDFVLFAALGDSENHWRVLCRKKSVAAAMCGVASLICLYFGVASGLYTAGAYHACTVLYPGYTNAWIALLTQAESVESMDRIADKILEMNASVSIAYSARARAAYAAGDFGAMIDEKKRAIGLARYSLEEYLDYFDMLYVGIQLYEENGDDESAAYCLQCLREIPEMLSDVKRGTDELAWKIADRPELDLPDEYMEILEQPFG